MFQKPFRVKSNSTVKGSDRKKIRSHLEKHYSSLSPEVLLELVPTKTEMSQLKVFTHGGQSVVVYVLGSNPIFFEVQEQVFPTVYTLWKYPDLLPSFPTWPPVFEKLFGGADLMQPGIVLRGDCSKFETLNIKDIVSVRLVGNKSPIAIGTSAINAEKLFSQDRKGKAVIILHTYGDQLWSIGCKSEPPLVADDLVARTSSDSEAEEEESEGADQKESEENPNVDSNSAKEVDEELEEKLDSVVLSSNEGDSTACLESKSEQEQMDQLLIDCFLMAMKTRMKKVELPLLTSTFYSAHILPCCPSDKTLDIRKSSYKKFSQFLKAMQFEGIIELKELSKGVISIVATNLEHNLVRRFKPGARVTVSEETSEDQTAYSPPLIEDLYAVSAAVLPFFKTRKIGKGACFSSSEVRKLLTDYITEENLKCPQNPRQVVLDPILTDALLNRSEYIDKLTWEDVVSRCLSKMSPAHKITFPNHEPMVRKGQIQPIEITVAQRTGNKKVTLVHNLESYGIDPEKFAHQVQVGVAASTSVGPSQAKKGTQVLVQGNQVVFISKVLLNEYQLPRKYITGLDKVPTKQKK